MQAITPVAAWRSAPKEVNRWRCPSPSRALESPYHKDGFAYDEARYRCPEGQLLRFTRIKRTRNTMMRLYRASGAVCRACPAFLHHGQASYAPWRATLCCVVTGLGCAPKKPNEHIDGECHWSNQSSHHQRAAASPRFLLRGLRNVAAEWTLLATAFNLRTLWRVRGATRLLGQGVGPSRKHPQPVERYRRLSRARPPPCFYS